MAAIRSRGNKETELKLAAILRAARITGWRRHHPLPGHPDFVFCHARLAVFVDGCFWHACRWHCRMPKDNRRYWRRKIAGNIARDRYTTRLLRTRGWRVLRIWGHSLTTPEAIADRIANILKENSLGRRQSSLSILSGNEPRAIVKSWNGKANRETLKR
jgi:DNA mismatch endonuclease (patch repair protein)